MKAGDEARPRAKVESLQKETQVSADIVIRGGTVVDGTGATAASRRRRGQPTA